MEDRDPYPLIPNSPDPQITWPRSHPTPQHHKPTLASQRSFPPIPSPMDGEIFMVGVTRSFFAVALATAVVAGASQAQQAGPPPTSTSMAAPATATGRGRP